MARSKPSRDASPSKSRVPDMIMLVVIAFFLVSTANAVRTGRVIDGKFSGVHETLRAERPQRFWMLIAIYSTLGVAAFVGSVKNLRRP